MSDMVIVQKNLEPVAYGNFSVSKPLFRAVNALVETRAIKNEAPETTVEEQGVRLEFSQHGHFDFFTIYKQTVPEFDLDNLPPPIATNLKTMYYVDIDVIFETTYHYLVATHRGNEIEYSEIGSVLVTFDPPYNVQATWNEDTQTVDLIWEFNE